jgi:uncharacterized protein
LGACLNYPMAKKKTRSLRCPTCRKIVLATDPEFPFCSGRCRVIDLGKWISGGYVISTPINDPESAGEAEYTAHRERPMGMRKAPEAIRRSGSEAAEQPEESERDGRRKPN